MLKNAIDKLYEGIEVNDHIIKVGRYIRDKYLEKENLEIYLINEAQKVYLLSIKVFYGRRPYYRPWVEFFNINNKFTIKDVKKEFFGSVYEDQLLSIISQNLEPGGKIYIEYYEDEETRHQLEIGVPPPITRLGFKLFKLGFTWFKDWYFPEGFLEGGQKLQAEKPLNVSLKAHQLKEILNDIKSFLKKISNDNYYDKFLINAIINAKNIFKLLSESNLYRL